MLMYGAIVDGTGQVQARSEGEVRVEGDLSLLLEDAMFEFRKVSPDTLLMTAIEEAGYEIRIGRV